MSSDRKEAYVCEVKSWIFDNNPNEWSFAVEEDLRDHSQMIDITDDETGEIHLNARARVTTYVNEVGYDKKLKSNVFIRERDDRAVHYFFHADEPLEPNQTVELLTNYGSHYENNRDRKGYGLKTMYFGDKDDSDQASKLRRDMIARSAMEAEVGFLEKPADVIRLISFVYEEMWTPLVLKASRWLLKDRSLSIKPLTHLQWRALFRMVYFSKSVKKKLVSFEGDPKYSADSTDKMNRSIENAGKMSFEKLELKYLSEPSFFNEAVRETVRSEMQEEVLYGLRDRIRRVCCAFVAFVFRLLWNSYKLRFYP